MDKVVKRLVKDSRLLIKDTEKRLRKVVRCLDHAAITVLQDRIADLKAAVDLCDPEKIRNAMMALDEERSRHLAFMKKSLFREYMEALVLAFIFAMIIRTFFVQAFKIPTGSMQPTLHGEHTFGIGDRILVSKFIYGARTLRRLPFTKIRIPFVRFPGLRTPQRGDIIVFETDGIPTLEQEEGGKDFIKRVVGLPNEEVEIRDGRILINGTVLDEPEIFKKIYYENRGKYGSTGNPVTVPAGMYFVLGDNSKNSKDGRYWGFVPFDNIKGKAFFIYWPVWPFSKETRWGFVE